MKTVVFNGSPNKEGNTWHALKMVTTELEKEGIETEIVQVGNKTIRGCAACGQSMKNKNEQCVLPGDEVNEWIQKVKLVEHGKGTVTPPEPETKTYLNFIH